MQSPASMAKILTNNTLVHMGLFEDSPSQGFI